MAVAPSKVHNHSPEYGRSNCAEATPSEMFVASGGPTKYRESQILDSSVLLQSIGVKGGNCQQLTPLCHKYYARHATYVYAQPRRYKYQRAIILAINSELCAA